MRVERSETCLRRLVVGLGLVDNLIAQPASFRDSEVACIFRSCDRRLVRLDGRTFVCAGPLDRANAVGAEPSGPCPAAPANPVFLLTAAVRALLDVVHLFLR